MDKKRAARWQRAAGTSMGEGALRPFVYYDSTKCVVCQGGNPHLLALVGQSQAFAARDLGAAALARERGDVVTACRLRRRGLLHQAVGWALSEAALEMRDG